MSPNPEQQPEVAIDKLTDQVSQQALSVVLWQRIRKRFTAKEILVVGTLLVQVGSTWATGLPLILIEQFAPKLIAKWKIQADRTQPRAKIIELLRHVVEGHLALLVAGWLLVKKLRAKKLDEIAEDSVSRPLPSIRRVLAELVINCMSWELCFYTSHRILHTARFYKAIHKQHHTFKAPVSLASNYAHAIEHGLGNVLPGFVAPMVLHLTCGSHLVSHWCWFAFGALLTNLSHSGYAFPFNPLLHCTLTHDYHHYSFYSQLGTFGVMDRIFGTDGGAEFKQWRSEVVNRIFKDAPAHRAFAQLF